MSHDCDDCGATFETLSGLRLHDCDDGSTAAGSARPATGSEASAVTPGPGATTGATGADDGGNGASLPGLDEQLDRVEGEPTAVYTALATVESALRDALDREDGGERYRAVFWTYYRPVADALDAVGREDWTLLADAIDAYGPAPDATTRDEPGGDEATGDPATGDPVRDGPGTGVSVVVPAIANAVGRHVVRTRLSADVDAIPSRALSFLLDVAVHADESDDTAREESHAYGWGIGHSDHPVADRLVERAATDPFWVHGALEHAFYADQAAATDALARIVTGDAGGTVEFPTGTLDVPRYLLDAVAAVDSETLWPTVPRYWDWRDEFDDEFAEGVVWEPDVETRLRELVVEAGVDAELSGDWTLADLEL
jgi:hypothetical protein